MKKLLLLFALLATTLSSWAASIPIDAAHFPDEEFRNYIFGNYANASNPNIKYNWAADGVLDDDEIAALTELYLDGAVHSHSYSGSITDVTGIEYFTNLEFLRIQYQPLLTLDLSHNTKLKEIYLWCQQQGQVTSLDLSQNVMLEEATIRLKTLTSLNLTNCVNLRWLDCGSNQLTSFNLGNCPSLTYLYCSSNPLPSLDLSDCPSLTYLWCNSTNGLLKSVNLSQCTELDTLKLGYNIGLQTLDLTHNTKLKYVELQENTSLQAVDFSHNTRLSYLDCSKCVSMGTLDVSGLSNIRKLNCQAAGTMSVNVANCNNLNTIDLRGTTMQSIDVSQCPALEQLLVAMCGLNSLDVTNNPQLYNLHFYQNSISSIDLSHNPKLQVIACWLNGLTALDLSDKPYLKSVDCYGNNITELDLSGVKIMYHLDCSNNKLTQLDLSKCSALTELRCYSNQLTSLDVRPATILRVLDCYNNKLTSLQICPNITTLKELNCSSNQLYYLQLESVQSPALQFSGNNQRRTGYLYTIGDKTYLHGMPSTLDRIVNFKVNGVSKPLTAGPYAGLVEVGEATDNISTITFDVETRYPNDTLYLNASYTVAGKRRVVPINGTTFPDYSFRNVVSTQISDDPDWLSLELAESYHKLDLENKGGVFNLEGIQYFCNLDTLWCPNNSVKVFDMSALPNLKVLNCSMNRVSPDYNAMAVVTLLETLPDNDDSWKTLYYRSERTGEYNATLTYDQCQYLKSKHWMPMEEYKVSGSTYAWREYEGISEAYGITFNNGATSVTAANSNDVFGDGTVRFDPIRNMLTLNGFNSTLRNSLSCSRENLLIKLLGDNTMGGTVSFAQNTTIVGPGSLTVSGSTQNLVEFSTSLHITDSARVTIAGTPTAYMGVGIRASSSGKLRVDGLNAQLSISASLYALNNLDSLILGEGYRIVTPVHSEFHGDFGGVQTPSGDYSKEVLIMYAPIYGDANDDSYIDSTDIDAIANILVGKAARTFGADVNCDGDVTISDLTTLSNKIRTPNGTVVNFVQNIAIPQALNMGVGDTRLITATLQPRDADVPAVAWTTSNNSVATVQANGSECTVTAVGGGTCVITCSATDGGGVRATCVVTVTESYVNLGLPSGTLWAKTNVGAETPEEVGTYFAWGETQPKSSYTTSNYFDQNNAIFKNKGGLTELTAEYDAATQQLGSSWQMPSRAQFEELLNEEYTTMEAVTDGSNNIGVKITSKMPGYTDKYIILPLAGEMNGTSLQSVTYAFYRTRNLSNGRYDGDSFVYRGCLYFSGNELGHIVNTSGKWQGQPVRAVRKQ